MEKKYIIHNDYELINLKSEIALMEKNNGYNNPDLIILNESGQFILSMLTEPKTKEEIIRRVIVKYKVKEEDVLKDIEEFMEQLLKKRILMINN